MNGSRSIPHTTVLYACLTISIGMLAPVQAVAGGESSLNFHGFISQGLLYSNHNNYYGESTEVSNELTEVGVNLRYAPAAATVLAGQIVTRRAGELYDGEPRVDYAFLEHSLYESHKGRLGVRVGRDKIPIGFFNETRDVPVTRPGILLPQSIYVEGLGIRDFYIGVDGGSLFWDWYANHGMVQLDFGVGLPADMEAETQNAFLGSGHPGDMQMTSGQNIRLLYEHHGGIWRLAATYSRVRTEYDAAYPPPTKPGDPMDIGDGEVAVDAFVLSAERNWENLRLTAEGVLRNITPDGFVSPLLQDNVTEAGYYLQSTYRLPRGWEVFLRYDSHWSDISDRDGTERAAELSELPTGPDPEPHRFFQHQWTAGVGWEVTPDWLLRAEWHRIHGTALTPAPGNPQFNEGGGASRWNLFALQASYQF